MCFQGITLNRADLLCKVNSRHPRRLLALLGAEKFVRLARRHCDCRWKIGLGTDLVMSAHLILYGSAAAAETGSCCALPLMV